MDPACNVRHVEHLPGIDVGEYNAAQLYSSLEQLVQQIRKIRKYDYDAKYEKFIDAIRALNRANIRFVNANRIELIIESIDQYKKQNRRKHNLGGKSEQSVNKSLRPRSVIDTHTSTYIYMWEQNLVHNVANELLEICNEGHDGLTRMLFSSAHMVFQGKQILFTCS